MVERPWFLNLDDYLALPRDSAIWLVEPLLPVSGTLLIYAQPKAGKSAMAIQLMNALSGGSTTWMTFPIGKVGRVLYLQLDVPRSTWADRFDKLKRQGITFNTDLVYIADRETIDPFPFDIMQPKNVKTLYDRVQALKPLAVVIDTLRRVHTGDEDKSGPMSGVLGNLTAACHPAALIFISHDRKPSPDRDKDIWSDHRGSNAVVGETDGVIRLTKSRLYYGGRNLEEDHIKIVKHDFDGVLWWDPVDDTIDPAILEVLRNPDIPGIRPKGRKVARILKISEDAAVSRVDRALRRLRSKGEGGLRPSLQGVQENPTDLMQAATELEDRLVTDPAE